MTLPKPERYYPKHDPDDYYEYYTVDTVRQLKAEAEDRIEELEKQYQEVYKQCESLGQINRDQAAQLRTAREALMIASAYMHGGWGIPSDWKTVQDALKQPQ